MDQVSTYEFREIISIQSTAACEVEYLPLKNIVCFDNILRICLCYNNYSNRNPVFFFFFFPVRNEKENECFFLCQMERIRDACSNFSFHILSIHPHWVFQFCFPNLNWFPLKNHSLLLVLLHLILEWKQLKLNPVFLPMHVVHTKNFYTQLISSNQRMMLCFESDFFFSFQKKVPIGLP